MKELVQLRQGRDADYDFVLSSWLKSYRNAEMASLISKDRYFRGHNELALDALGRSNLLVAVARDDSDHIYGWLCHQQGEPTIIHYLYVKYPFRSMGIAKILFEEIIPPGEPFVFTHLPEGKLFNKAKEHGTYDHYPFFIPTKSERLAQ